MLYLNQSNRKEVIFMAVAKDIHLTDDPLTNIYAMIPLLGDKEREAVSFLMYGCCIGRELAEKDKDKQEEVLCRIN